MGSQNESKALLERIAAAAAAAPSPGFGMTGAAMVQLMGGKVDRALLSGVLSAAGAAGEVSEGSAAESRGLLVSEEDLKNIFRYVDEALGLPATEAAAEEYLGYKKDDEFFKDERHKFLLPAKQAEFDAPIIANAGRWAGIEMAIKGQGTGLDQYAREFVTSADAVLRVLEDLKAYLKVHGFVDEGGKEIVEGGVELLKGWERDTARRREETERLKELLGDFDRELENRIRPSVDGRKDEVSGLNLSEEIKKLNADVNRLKDEISALQKEYDECTGLAFSGAAGLVVPIPFLGIISWAVTGGIYGAKAEKARKAKNEREERLRAQQRKLDADNRIVGGIQRLEAMLTDFQGAVRAAIMGVQHVGVVWGSIAKDIQSAQEHIGHISDPEYVTMVASLTAQVKLARESWASCGGTARELVAQFDAARAHYKK